MLITIDKQSTNTLIRQIYNQIRSQILNGKLPAGKKLPATRELAVDLSVSRNVVIEAYELLMAEGFLESKRGSGTYVAQGVCLDWEKFESSSTPENHLPVEQKITFIDFRSGVPDLNAIPQKKLAQLAYKTWVHSSKTAFSYDLPAGNRELRESITQYLKRTRGVVCDPKQIIITSGSVQGLSLAAKTLLSSGKRVLIEDPSNKDIRKIFAAQGAEIVPGPVDENGLITELLSTNEQIDVIQVTPSHQYPLGGILPIRRRLELIRFAQKMGAYIIEDDYDSEYRYEGPPVSSLQGLAPERVIYLGTFSKILFPSLRLGYMILPKELFSEALNLKRLSDIHTNSQNQLVLAEFIKNGGLERHIARMKKIYRKKRDHFIKSLKTEYPNELRIWGSSTGIHLVVEFPGVHFDESILTKIKASGVGVYPVEEHAIKKDTHTQKLIFGYGHLSEMQIEEGIKLFSKTLNEIIVPLVKQASFET